MITIATPSQVIEAVAADWKKRKIRHKDVAEKTGYKTCTINGIFSYRKNYFTFKQAARLSLAFGYDMKFLMLGEGSLYGGDGDEVPERATAVVCDIDGTVSLVNPERAALLRDGDTDWDAFYRASFDDEPVKNVCDLVRHLSRHHRIVFCTSRRDSVREKTDAWLREHLGTGNFPHGCELLMRRDDDPRPDTVVKPELLGAYLAGHGDDVLCVIEDSASMARTWTSLGYTCLQVA